jgi:serine/threonine-protein kinase
MLAHECLTGHKPFHRESPVATALAHLNDPPPTLPDDFPEPVRRLVSAMVEKDPADRPASAAEVAQRAAVLTDASGALVLPPPPSRARREAVRTPPWRREALRSRRLQVSAATVAVALLATVFVAARPSPAQVPDVEGQGWSEARSLLEEEGLVVEREVEDRPGIAPGTVLDQSPEAGEVDGDTAVTLTVASGEVVLALDDVTGMTYEEAAPVLVRLGLVPARRDVPRPGGDGTVVTAVPSGRLPVGTMVTLNVGTSDGVVPDDEGPRPTGSGR